MMRSSSAMSSSSSVTVTRCMRGAPDPAWCQIIPADAGLARAAPRPALLGDALDLGDHRLGAQLPDDGVEMLEVVDLEVDGQRGEIGRLPLHADVIDIAVVLGDHLGDLRQRPGLVEIGRASGRGRGKEIW